MISVTNVSRNNRIFRVVPSSVRQMFTNPEGRETWEEKEREKLFRGNDRQTQLSLVSMGRNTYNMRLLALEWRACRAQ